MNFEFLEIDVRVRQCSIKVGNQTLIQPDYLAGLEFIKGCKWFAKVRIVGYCHDKKEFVDVLRLVLHKTPEVDLHHNGLGSDAISICQIIASSETILSVDLSSNSLCESGPAVIASFSGSRIKAVEVSNNWIDRSTIKELNDIKVSFSTDDAALAGSAVFQHVDGAHCE